MKVSGLRDLGFTILFVSFIVLKVLLPVPLYGSSGPFYEMAEELSLKAKAGGVQRVAVLYFESVTGSGGASGRVVQERLISAFVKQGIVSVIERERLEALKKELTLGMTGLMDESTTKRIGKVLGVDGLVLGSLTDLGKGGNLEANARLVAVETGEVLGAVTKKFQKTWLELEKTEPLSPFPLDGWRMPTSLAPTISSSTLPGTVIFKNNLPLVETDPAIVQITLVEEDLSSVTFDLEYYLPKSFEGKLISFGLFPFNPSSTGQPALTGRHNFQVRLSPRETDPYFSATTTLIVVVMEEQNSKERGQSWQPVTSNVTISFRKIWINPRCKGMGNGLTKNRTMQITRVDPPVLSWNKPFTLYGEFGHLFSKNPKVVVVGGNELYRFLKVLKWQKDYVVVQSPKSGKPKIPDVRVDPELPYFVSVNEESNLFIVTFDPEGLPDWP